MAIKCTQCGHERGPGEQGAPSKCPACGAVYTTDALFRASKEPPSLPAENPDQPPAPLAIKWPTTIDVRVSDIDVSFTSMVWIMVKLVFAAIPAALIVVFIWAMIISFTAGIFRH